MSGHQDPRAGSMNHGLDPASAPPSSCSPGSDLSRQRGDGSTAPSRARDRDGGPTPIGTRRRRSEPRPAGWCRRQRGRSSRYVTAVRNDGVASTLDEDRDRRARRRCRATLDEDVTAGRRRSRATLDEDVTAATTTVSTRSVTAMRDDGVPPARSTRTVTTATTVPPVRSTRTVTAMRDDGAAGTLDEDVTVARNNWRCRRARRGTDQFGHPLAPRRTAQTR